MFLSLVVFGLLVFIWFGWLAGGIEREIFLFGSDEFFEHFEGEMNEIHSFLLFLAEPILEAAFAPAGEIGLADAGVAVGREPGDDVLVFLVAHEPESDFVADSVGEARDLAGAAMVAVLEFRAFRASGRRDGWIGG